MTNQNWGAIVRVGENWFEVLKAEPFNFTDVDLNVVPAAPQAAAE